MSERQMGLFGGTMEPTTPPGKLVLAFSLTVPGRLPSWNEILGMEHWARYKFKQQLAEAFLCALRQSAGDSLTTTTFAKNTTLTYADTLESYLETARRRRALRSASKSRRGRPKKSTSKFSESKEKVPF